MVRVRKKVKLDMNMLGLEAVDLAAHKQGRLFSYEIEADQEHSR